MSKKKSGNTVVGYDINDVYAQISYMRVNDSEPQTASVVLGAEQYDIPVALRPKQGTKLWYYGKEALKGDDSGKTQASNPAATVALSHAPITRLLSLAIEGAMISVDGYPDGHEDGKGEQKRNQSGSQIGSQISSQLDPVALLALFIKRSLSVLTTSVKMSDVAVFMFTTPVITPRVIEIFTEVARNLEISPERVFLQGYHESVFQYIIHQPQEFRQHQVLLFDYTSHLKAMMVRSNKRTTPTVVYIDSKSHPSFYYTSVSATGLSATVREDWDRRFLAIAEEAAAGELISSVYLIGEGFKEDWAFESLKYLCRGRRVFRGSNLYSKGAAYGAMEKLSPTEQGKSLIFLGEDRLKANIGMRLIVGGEEAYHAILDAGGNWYECNTSFEVIMDGGSELALVVTALTGGVVSERLISLDGLPERERRTTRLRIDINMESVSTVRLEVTDLGFGEIQPASGKFWIREFTVS
ncbi:MAG: DUF5716 family protein [Lachnospiraceae bacterium]|jgi:hypothetical protein|nr:DUF5716 family protein [Lachnospiraceae bacterium]